MAHGTCGGWYEAGSEVAGNEIHYLSMLCHQVLDCGKRDSRSGSQGRVAAECRGGCKVEGSSGKDEGW